MHRATFLSKHIISTLILGFIVSGFADAAVFRDDDVERHQDQRTSGIRYMAAISGGASWSKAGSWETFYLQPDLEKSYVPIKKSSIIASGEAFFGLHNPLNSYFSAQLGVAVATSSAAKIHGEIWEDADPDFNNFWYSYRVTHSRVALKGKLLFNCSQSIQTYVSGSAGVGFNRSYNFKITQKIFEEIPSPAFSNHNDTSFAYTGGAGIQKTVDNHTQVSVGYEFADWGQSSLGRAPGQTMNGGLHMNHLYTQGVQFTISYIA